MPDQTNPEVSRLQRLDELIGEFLVAQDAGRDQDPSEWLARHPDLCPELAEFFADQERMDELVEPLRKTTEPTVDVARDSNADDDSGESGAFPSSTRVRYFGDYELLKVLGEGGMGIVYKARQVSLNRSVALKMIKAARFASADEIRRFQNESEAVARLDHPNIVPIFEVGQFEDQHYFSMKLISGESLDKRRKAYLGNPRQAAELLSMTARAIHHAHQRGILHRDLKPANILIDPEGRPHVTDFGLAKRVEADSELTRSGAIMGTPAYMAPEQASGKRGAVTTVTDVYGLGAVLYALLTGKAPVGGDSVVDTLEQVRERSPEPPSKLNPKVPRDLDVICLKCLEKDPRRRYVSADALHEDLRRWLDGEPIAARPVGKAARAWMWCRRNPVIAGAATLVVTALVAVAALSLLYAVQQTRLAKTTALYADEQRRRGNEQAEAATKIGGLNNNLEKERQGLKVSLAETNRHLSMLYFERGRIASEQGDVGPGLLWLLASWRAAAAADDPAWKRVSRTSLAAWARVCPKVKAAFDCYGDAQTVAFSPDGKVVLIGARYGHARLWDAGTGQPIGHWLAHPLLEAGMFSPDGKKVLTIGLGP
jgi:tRNA A-37 threonylcarbamoyl transferase component Bud32